MTFDEFQARAKHAFEEIPADFKQGVDGLEVTRKTVLHPTLPDIFTLGECLSDFYPSDFGGPGEVRSRVVLYYGSFQAVARGEDEFDWKDEIWETITHEIRHHLEHLASEDALEEMDYAEDQNFARREGELFDPLFFRSGEALGTGVWAVDGDVFLERTVASPSSRNGSPLAIDFLGSPLHVNPPEEIGDVSFLRVVDPPKRVKGELFVVLIRRGGPLGWLRGILRPSPPKVVQEDASVALSDSEAGR